MAKKLCWRFHWGCCMFFDILLNEIQNHRLKGLESGPLFAVKFLLCLHLLEGGFIDHEEKIVFKAQGSASVGGCQLWCVYDEGQT